VHSSWNAYFSNVDAGAAPGHAHVSPPLDGSASPALPAGVATPAADHAKLLNLFMLLRSFQVYGHEFADTNPLIKDPKPLPLLLIPSYYGLTGRRPSWGAISASSGAILSLFSLPCCCCIVR
jgi:2-oxoglutarate dehydrogenase E1 component